MGPFLDCDIRGIYGDDITEEFARALGRAVGSMARGERVLIAGDYRTHTRALKSALATGLQQAGCHVMDFGQMPTPMYYFARQRHGIETAVMVTASHNPPEYAGFKPILGELPITPEEIEEIESRMGLSAPDGPHVGLTIHEVEAAYWEWIIGEGQRFLPGGQGTLGIVVDCGNGAFGPVAPAVLRELGFTVTPLYETPDGTFPNRPSNVALEDGRRDAQEAVLAAEADIGVAYDGDGDRIAFIDNAGRSVPNDTAIALLCADALAAHPGGAVVYDIKCSRVVPEAVQAAGGRPVAQKSGHTFIKRTMIEERAAFGGELSGHLFYPELHGGDDALYSTLRMAALIQASERDLAALLDEIPRYAATPDLRIPAGDDAQQIVDRVRAAMAERADCRTIEIDGVRADFDEGWGLVRVSVTEPVVTLRFEARKQDQLRGVIERFLATEARLRDQVRGRRGRG